MVHAATRAWGPFRNARVPPRGSGRLPSWAPAVSRSASAFAHPGEHAGNDADAGSPARTPDTTIVLASTLVPLVPLPTAPDRGVLVATVPRE